MIRNFFFFFLTVCTLAAYPGNSAAEMQPVRKLRAGLPPFEVLEKVLITNQQSADKIKPNTDLTQLKTPYLTWLTDADTRLQEQLILSTPGKPLYTVRNLGNQLALSPGSIDFGVRHLHTPILLITGSTDSLAIRLAMEGYKDMDASIRKDLDHLHIPLASSPKGKTAKKPDPTEQLLLTAEANVDYQVEQAVQRYQDRINSGRLVVVGGIIDLANAYERGPGRLIIINVNNERNDKKIKRLRLMTRLTPKLINTQIGRYRPQRKKGGGK